MVVNNHAIIINGIIIIIIIIIIVTMPVRNTARSRRLSMNCTLGEKSTLHEFTGHRSISRHKATMEAVPQASQHQ